MIEFDNARRRLVIAAGAGLVLAGANNQIVQAAEKHDDDEKEVGAVEDLMREHGVLRRAILVYREAAVKLRAKPAGVDPERSAAPRCCSVALARIITKRNSKRRIFFRRSREPAAQPRLMSISSLRNINVVARSPIICSP